MVISYQHGILKMCATYFMIMILQLEKNVKKKNVILVITWGMNRKKRKNIKKIGDMEDIVYCKGRKHKDTYLNSIFIYKF